MLGCVLQRAGDPQQVVAVDAAGGDDVDEGHRAAGDGARLVAREPRVKPFLLVLSSPSGGGKTTIARNLLQGAGRPGYSVSATTRPMREGERMGWTTTSWRGGVPPAAGGRRVPRVGHLRRTSLRDAAQRDRPDLRRRAARGARHRDRRRPADPRELSELAARVRAAAVGRRAVGRLRGRNTEPAEAVRERIARAAEELDAVAEYDYAIVNDDLVLAVAQVAAILDAEARRVSRQTISRRSSIG